MSIRKSCRRRASERFSTASGNSLPSHNNMVYPIIARGICRLCPVSILMSAVKAKFESCYLVTRRNLPRTLVCKTNFQFSVEEPEQWNTERQYKTQRTKACSFQIGNRDHLGPTPGRDSSKCGSEISANVLDLPHPGKDPQVSRSGNCRDLHVDAGGNKRYNSGVTGNPYLRIDIPVVVYVIDQANIMWKVNIVANSSTRLVKTVANLKARLRQSRYNTIILCA